MNLWVRFACNVMSWHRIDEVWWFAGDDERTGRCGRCGHSGLLDSQGSWR